MIQTFFAVLFLILGLSFTVHSIFYEKKNLLFIIGLMVFSIISLFYWYMAILVLILFSLYKKYDFGEFATLNMFTAVLMSWFFLKLFMLNLNISFYFIAMISLVAMSLLAIFGIFEQKLKKYNVKHTTLEFECEECLGDDKISEVRH